MNIYKLLLTIIVALLVFYMLYCMGANKMEMYQNYMTLPFDEVKTGSNPLDFYRKDKYRKPYRYPFKFHQSYPVPHMTHYGLL